MTVARIRRKPCIAYIHVLQTIFKKLLEIQTEDQNKQPIH